MPIVQLMLSINWNCVHNFDDCCHVQMVYLQEQHCMKPIDETLLVGSYVVGYE